VTASGARPLVVGNWKMNLTETEATSLARALVDRLPFDRVDAAIAPAFPCLRAVLDATAGSRLAVAAQNMHWEAKGAFTGEVAPPMLRAMGVRFVILGHSERRQHFGESDAIVCQKVGAARRHGLIPIICVGEHESERDLGRTRDVVAAQIRAALADPALDPASETVIAYEPVWAIGTGRTPEEAEIAAAHDAIRDELALYFGPAASQVRVLYGGSVTAATAASLLRSPGVDGALVGGASLDAASFAAIAAAAAAC
jgi:triosephosphate isomerase